MLIIINILNAFTIDVNVHSSLLQFINRFVSYHVVVLLISRGEPCCLLYHI